MKICVIKFFLFTLITLLASCADLFSHRSFQAEMEQEETRLFVAERDFPLAAGDSGRVAPDRKELLARTPGLFEEKRSNSEKSALNKELYGLEQTLSPEEYNHYLKYRNKLGGTSQRIYFLKIMSVRAKNEYLFSKGLYQYNTPEVSDVEEAVRNREIMVGMHKNDVVRSWGRPTRIDVAGNPSYGNERWSFYYRGRVRKVFFQQSEVEGWVLD